MSLLLNPSFEEGTAAWQRLNEANAVNFSVETDPERKIPVSGQNYLRFRSAVSGGSMAQDVTIAMPSITALAFVRAAPGVGQVAGAFAIWDLNANRNVSVNFTVGEAWVPLTAMLSFANAASRPVRIEMYVSTVNVDLYVDGVNAF
jgi:hypothetical protein